MRIAAGIGLLMMMLHGLVDFNLHIPANAVFFAFLAGVFFHQARQTEPTHSARQAPAPRPPVTPGPAPATLPELPAPAPEIRNPFAD
jgi:hypothetical protein